MTEIDSKNIPRQHHSFATISLGLGSFLSSMNPSSIIGAIGGGIAEIARGIGDGGSEIINSIGHAGKDIEDGAADIVGSVFGGLGGLITCILCGLLSLTVAKLYYDVDRLKTGQIRLQTTTPNVHQQVADENELRNLLTELNRFI